jgi:hypothetical protein
MNDRDPQVQALLDRHTPPATGSTPSADWDDVMRRSSAAQPGRRLRVRWAPRGFLIAAAVALLMGGSALAGVGPGHTLVRLLRDDRPAPSVVRDRLRQTPSWPDGSHVVPNASRSVLRVGPVTMWIAPTTSGGHCIGTYAGGGYAFTCDPAPAQVDAIDDLTDVNVAPSVVSGTAPKATARVVMLYEDDSRRDLRVSSVSFPDFVFFADTATLAQAHLRPGHRPLALVAYDRAGRLLAVAHFAVGEFSPNADTTSPSAAWRPVDVPAAASTAFGPTQPGHRPTWIGTATDGSLCLLHEADVTGNVAAPQSVRAIEACGGPLAGLTAIGDAADGIVFGTIPAGASHVQVQFQDGTETTARTAGGRWLLELSAAQRIGGRLPLVAIATSIDGVRVATHRFRPTIDFFGAG